MMYDSALTGSDGKVSMVLKDNGRGSLYRADCLTKQATWSNVGNIFYLVQMLETHGWPNVGSIYLLANLFYKELI